MGTGDAGIDPPDIPRSALPPPRDPAGPLHGSSVTKPIVSHSSHPSWIVSDETRCRPSVAPLHGSSVTKSSVDDEVPPAVRSGRAADDGFRCSGRDTTSSSVVQAEVRSVTDDSPGQPSSRTTGIASLTIARPAVEAHDRGCVTDDSPGHPSRPTAGVASLTIRHGTRRGDRPQSGSLTIRDVRRASGRRASRSSPRPAPDRWSAGGRPPCRRLPPGCRAGISSRHTSIAHGQRVMNGQPAGGRDGSGGSPASTIRCLPRWRRGLGIGTAESRPRL